MVPGYWQFASVLVFVLFGNSIAFLDRNCDQRGQFCFVEQSAEHFRLDHQSLSTSSKRFLDSVKDIQRSDFRSAENSGRVRENRNSEVDGRSSEFRYRQERREISEQSRLDRRNVIDQRDIQSRLDRQIIRNRINSLNGRSREERDTNRNLRKVDSARIEDQLRIAKDSKNSLRLQERQERNQRLNRVQLNRNDRSINREEESSLRRRNTYGNQIRDRLQERIYSINRDSGRFTSTQRLEVRRNLIRVFGRNEPQRVDYSRRIGVIRESELNRNSVERETQASFNKRQEGIRMREVREQDFNRLSVTTRRERQIDLQNRRNDMEALRKERFVTPGLRSLEREVRGSLNTRREVERVTDRREKEILVEGPGRSNLLKRDNREARYNEQRNREQTEVRQQENIPDSRQSRNEREHRVREARDQGRITLVQRDWRALQRSLVSERLDRREETRSDQRSSSLGMERRNEQRSEDRRHKELYRHDFRKERGNVRDAEDTLRQLTRNSEEQRRLSRDVSRTTSRHVELRQDVTREIAREDLRLESRRVNSQRLSDQPQAKAANENIAKYSHIPFAQILQALLIGALVIKTLMQQEIASKKLSSINMKLGAALQKIKTF